MKQYLRKSKIALFLVFVLVLELVSTSEIIASASDYINNSGNEVNDMDTMEMADNGAYEDGNVYYVSSTGTDKAEGTLESPLSIDAALSLSQPGDSIYMLAGWYAGTIDLASLNVRGAENAYIHITNYGNDAVYVYGTATSPAFKLSSNNAYIDISGLTIQLLSSDYQKAEVITMYNSSNINVHDNIIKSGSLAFTIKGECNNCEIYNNTFVENFRDFYINGLINSKVYHNIFKSNYVGIYNWGGKIENNIFTNNIFAGPASIEINGSTSVKNNVIVNNIFAKDGASNISDVLKDDANNNLIDYNYFTIIPDKVGSHNVEGELGVDGNYHIISPDSVLINAGDDRYAPMTDKDGQSRVGQSDIGLYEYQIKDEIPEVIPDWGLTMTHPSIINEADLSAIIVDIANGPEAEDADQINLGTSIENIWANLVDKTEESYLNEDYYLDGKYKRLALYYPYVQQPARWGSTSSLQVGDNSTDNSYATAKVEGIKESTYYVNFDFKPVQPELAKDYIIYQSQKDSNGNGVILKMSNSKILVSNGSDNAFIEVPDLTLTDGRWYNIYLVIDGSGNGTSSLIIHPRGASEDYRTNYQIFGNTAIDGVFLGHTGAGTKGMGHYDNIRIYDTYIPVFNEIFSNLRLWTINGAVKLSNEGVYATNVGTYYWTTINSDLQIRLQNLATAARVKKDIGDADAELYFTKAKQLMLSIAHWNNWGDPDELEKASLDIGYITQAMSFAYDLLYHDLTVEERELIAKAIKKKGIDVLYAASTTATEYGYYDGVSLAPNTMFVQNGSLGLAALVVGDVFNTEEALRVARKNLLSAYQHGVDQDGAWAESFNYGDLAIVYTLPFHDADQRITGNDSINHTYLNRIIDYVIYNQFPGGKYYSNIADNGVGYSYQYKKIMEYYVKNGKNAYAAWALKRLGSLPSSNDLLSLIWFPMGATVLEPTEETLALGKLFSDMGLAALKTGWDTTDSLVTLKSSKHTGNLRHHTHLDQNSIELMRGTSNLLADPGYQSWSGLSRSFNYGTLGHNTLVLNGKSQNGYDSASDWTNIFGGQIESFFIGDRYGFSVASAGLAYTDLINKVENIPEWRRSIVDIIGNDYYVLFDDYQTKENNMDLVWQLHSDGKWSRDTASNALITTINNDQLAVIFLNADAKDVQIQSNSGYEYDSERIYYNLKTGKENNNLLALLYPSDKGAILPNVTYLTDADDHGVVVTKGGVTDVILFHKDSGTPVVLANAVHRGDLGSISIETGRVNKVVLSYTADKDMDLVQDGVVIGTLIGDGTKRVDTFELQETMSNTVTLSTLDDTSIHDIWYAGTTKTDALSDNAIGEITLPNPDAYYDLELTYSNSVNGVVKQDGVIIGALDNGSGTVKVSLHKPYRETMINGVRTSMVTISLEGAIAAKAKLAENEVRNQIGRTLNVGGENDTEYADYNVSGMTVVGNWSDPKFEGETSYRTGSSGATMYVNSPSKRNTYAVYLKYRANTNVSVSQYKSNTTKVTIAELPSTSSWKIASFPLKEFDYSALNISKYLVTNRMIQFSEGIEIDSAWIELRESDRQVDYTDVGKADDMNMIKHNPGIVIGENFDHLLADSRKSDGNGTIIVNIPEIKANYYVNLILKANTSGIIRQLMDETGSEVEIAEYDKAGEFTAFRFKLNGNYYDSKKEIHGTQVVLSIVGDIEISDMWLDREVQTLFDDLDEVDYGKGSTGQGETFIPDRYTAMKRNTTITIDGTIDQDEMWNLDMNLSYGTENSDEFRAIAGVQWDKDHFYMAIQVTDDEDFDAGSSQHPYDILDGDGIEVYIAKNRGNTVYDAHTVQYVFSTLHGIYVGGGNGYTDKTKVVTTGIEYQVTRNQNGYVMEMSIPWASIGGMTVEEGDKIGFTLHAFDKDTNKSQYTIGLNEQYLSGDWCYPFYWPELTLSSESRIPTPTPVIPTPTPTPVTSPDEKGEVEQGNTKKLKLEIGLNINYKLPVAQIIALLQQDYDNYEVIITIPETLFNKTEYDMKNIILSQKVLSVLKNQQKDLTITIQDTLDKEIVQWKLQGSQLGNIKFDLNLAVRISKSDDIKEIKEILKKNKSSNQGLVLSFSQANVLPGQANVKIYLGDHKIIGKNKSVYLYGVDASNKLLSLPNNKYKVDADGYVSINIVNGGSYVILPKKADNSIVTSLLNQVSVGKKATISVGKTQNLKVTLPASLYQVDSFEGITEVKLSPVRAATVIFKSSDKKIVKVNAKGKLTAVKSGKATVKTKVTLHNGKTMIFTTTVTVKK